MKRLVGTLCLLGGVVSICGSGDPHPYASDQPITEPKLFSEGVISTPFDEFGLAFSHDGRTAFFNRSVPRSNLYVICTSTFRDGRWS
jgi:hypothetical protein